MGIFLSLTLDEWIFAIGGLVFILLGKLLVQSLAPKQTGALGFVTTILTAVPRTLILFTQKIVSTFAPVTFKPQQRVAAGLYQATQLVDDTATVIEQQAAIIAALAQALAGTATSSDLAGIEAGLNRRIGNAEAQARGIGADVLPRLKTTEGTLSADVLPKIASLDREIAGVRTRDIPRVNTRVNGLADDLATLWKWAHRHVVAVGTVAFAGAVAIALQRIGASWIRCSNWRNIGKVGCSLEADALSGLLGALFTVEALANLRTLVKVAQEAEHGVAAGIKDLLDV